MRHKDVPENAMQENTKRQRIAMRKTPGQIEKPVSEEQGALPPEMRYNAC